MNDYDGIVTRLYRVTFVSGKTTYVDASSEMSARSQVGWINIGDEIERIELV